MWVRVFGGAHGAAGRRTPRDRCTPRRLRATLWLSSVPGVDSGMDPPPVGAGHAALQLGGSSVWEYWIDPTAPPSRPWSDNHSVATLVQGSLAF